VSTTPHDSIVLSHVDLATNFIFFYATLLLSEVITLINVFFCLNIDNQIAEVVNCMKDLIDHSRQTGSGPIGAVLLTVFYPVLVA
jgi:hypothetical protein